MSRSTPSGISHRSPPVPANSVPAKAEATTTASNRIAKRRERRFKAGVRALPPARHACGNRAAATASSRSCEISTAPTPRCRAHGPAAASVALSDTSTESGCNSSSRSRTRENRWIIRYPPLTGTLGSVTTSPDSLSSRECRWPGITSTRSCPAATYPLPSSSTTVRRPPEVGL